MGDRQPTPDPPIQDLHFDNAPDVDTIPGPESKQLLDQQQAIDSNAIAYPRRVPIAIDEARGATVRDVDGNTFLDFFAGIGVLNVGHSNPYVLEAVHNQMDKVTHTIDFPTETRLELIEKLDSIAPGKLSGSSRVLFGGPTGSDAIEGSIKLAKYNTEGMGLISFRGSYHGTTSGAGSLTAGKKYKQDYTPLLPDVAYAPYPQDETDVEHALQEVRDLIEDPYGGLTNPAGIWVEPIQGKEVSSCHPTVSFPGSKKSPNGMTSY
jgi:diaminobutyrate-2-oxoglutarate transaminase